MDTLHPYQRLAIQRLLDSPKAALWLEPGLGKSVITLKAVEALLDSVDVRKVLVVAPLRVVLNTWPAEIAKWGIRATYQTIHGSPAKRRAAVTAPADLYLINYESLTWLVAEFGKHWPFDMVVLDECFPNGTIVRTPQGEVCIESISPGDIVESSDGPREVSSVTRGRSQVLVDVFLDDGRCITSTPNHPFFTDTGWVCAGNLEIGGRVYDTKDVRSLLTTVYREVQPEQVLQYILLSEMENEPTGDPGKGLHQRDRAENLKIQEGPTRPHPVEQRATVAGGVPNQTVRGLEESRSEAFDTGREWAAAPDTGPDAFDRIALACPNGTRHIIGKAAARLSNMLQGRYRTGGREPCHRSRRWVTYESSAPRQEKRRETRGTRVARIAYRELDSAVDVYSLEIKGCPHFYANGCLVHNSSKMKSRSSQRWKALAAVTRQITRLVELTGTPAPNGLLDLWAQIALLDRGERLGRSLTRYRERWFDADFMGFKFTPKAHAEAEIHAAVADIVLTLRTEDYLTLPDTVPITLPVTLPGPARKLYTQLEKEMFLALEQGDVTAVSAATLSNKARQCAAGALYIDGGNGAWQEVHHEKINALLDLVDELSGAPLLVAYNYQSDLARLRLAFPRARVLDENPRTVDAWNSGQIPLLLAHPASCGHGLNLQAGGHHICWFSLDWNLELYIQFNARLHRQGQDRPVFIYHLIATDTVDELVLERLRSKRTVQDVLLDALKVQIGT